MSYVELSEVFRRIGLEEELKDMDEIELATDFMSAAIIGLSDGDLVALHAPYEGRKAELYDTANYATSRVARAILRASIEDGPNPGTLYDFQTLAAEFYHHPEGPFRSHDSASTLRIHPEVITIDDEPVALARTPSRVIEYGACMTSQSCIEDQINFRRQGKRPFGYIPLTRQHFTNRVLADTYKKFGERTSNFLQEGLFIGREDGVASATNEIIRAQRTHNARTDIADIVVCANPNHSTREDLKTGIVNAHTLLKEDGMLLIRSGAHPADDEIGAKEMAEWALNAGFEEKHMLHYQNHHTNVGSLILTGIGTRQVDTYILRR